MEAIPLNHISSCKLIDYLLQLQIWAYNYGSFFCNIGLIRYRNVDTLEYWSVFRTNSDVPAYTAQNLASCQEYEFRVAAVNKHGIGKHLPATKHLTQKTDCPEDPEELPPKPGKVKVIEKTLFSLDTKWLSSAATGNYRYTLA